jgi:hypothetical protein
MTSKSYDGGIIGHAGWMAGFPKKIVNFHEHF